VQFVFVSQFNTFGGIANIQIPVFRLSHHYTVRSNTRIVTNLDVLQHDRLYAQEIAITQHHSSGDVAGRHDDVAVAYPGIVTDRNVTIE
jgi:hypothetical protein